MSAGRRQRNRDDIKDQSKKHNRAKSMIAPKAIEAVLAVVDIEGCDLPDEMHACEDHPGEKP